MFYGLDVTSVALNAMMLKYDELANNIANVDTPGFKRKDVEFESILQKQIDSYGMNHLKLNQIQPKIYTDMERLSTRLDGNNVDIDLETAELSEVKLKYDTLIQRAIAQIGRYEYVLGNIK
ncbi:flagellar basal-body rod protein FlgB [Candidatus Epulonipiscium fishelsonii]|uniref:Flagellar basal-body rod protein FlgB n=1 Tax=Candidatus Epulonipiscium fishelsonii TaxID=77094 RepID=A0ACC8XJK5_9FIRM|nr:flagellar basal-body rod protein FlgB [Epulopiscium sp. SCG-D08WGA-EpuloA1]